MSNTLEFTYSEQPALDLFQRMGYGYYDASIQDERKDITEVVLKERLLKSIKRINPWISDLNLQMAYNELTGLQAASLMEANQKVWELVRGSKLSLKQVIDGKEEFRPVWFIDYLNPENNDFLVVNQMKFHGLAQNSKPDLVVFVNGLPLGVIECKSPTATNAWDSAYSDLRFYQENSEKLFHYNQICAGIWQVQGKYSGIKAPASAYSYYRADDTTELKELLGTKPTEQDIMLYSLFQKERLLDIVRHFVIFELDEGTTIKKLPRYQQIRATNKTIEKLQAHDQGGVVWHTQGSGKSITMAYITRKLQAPEFGFDNPTIMVMTDRKDLDRQITSTFQAIGFKGVQQASSVKHLDKLLRNDYGGIITTTLQKFQEKNQEDSETQDQTEQDENQTTLVEKSISGNVLVKVTKLFTSDKWMETSREEIILEELSQKENLYILVDEAHRSHYGFLASFMRTVLPKAKFIAFTGTPISKEDKSTLAEFYGQKYIDIYTIKESVADGATVELLYDEGIAKLDIKKEELDKEFEAKFGTESEDKKDRLKSEALRKYQLSSERILEVSKHLLNHYSEKIYPDGHKAMIVCAGREAAIRYQQTILQLKAEGYHDFESKVIVSLGSPKSDEIARAYYETLEWNKNNPHEIRPLLVTPSEDVKDATERFKLPFEHDAKGDTKEEKKYDNTAFLIVSDMLLTGYDAPIASCLYLDKPLKEHNLLQAIARVNRSRKGKNAGYIVDYNGITNHLIQALEIFSGDVKPNDILKNINEEIPTLAINHTKLVDFFKPMKVDRNYERDRYIDAAICYIEPLDKRDMFKDLLKQFNKSINIVLPNVAAMQFQKDFKLFNEIRLRARNAYPEDEDLKVTKEESRMLQQLIDEHLTSEGVENLLNEPISIIDRDQFKKDIMNASPATKELKMRNNLKYVIKVGLGKNPAFYKPLAERLEELLKQRQEERITQTEFLKALTSMQEEIINENKEGNEKGFKTEREIAVFNTMKTIFNGEAEEMTQKLFADIQGELGIIGWQDKGMVKQDMAAKITNILKQKLERKEAKEKAAELVEVLRKNKDA
jgi:type I restriction enzyme R subunit